MSNETRPEEDDLRASILRLLRRDKFKTVREIRDLLTSENPSLKEEQILTAVRKLDDEDKVVLVPPSLPPTFSSYLFDVHENPFFLVYVASSALFLLAVLAISYQSQFVLIRSAIAAIYSLVLPGFASTTALFPKREQLKMLERIAVSLGISLSLLVASVLYLAYSPFRATFFSLAILLAAYTIVMSLVASHRKYSTLKEELEGK